MRRGNKEGTIYYNEKRKRYEGQIRYVKPDGKYGRKLFTGHSQKEVMQKIKDFNEQCDNPGAEMTVKEWMDKWLNEYKRPEIKIKTYERYRCAIVLHINHYIGKELLKNLTTLKIQELINKLTTAPAKKGGYLAPRTINSVRRILISAFNDAVTYDILPKNPALGTKPVRVEKTAMHILSKKEAAELLHVARKADYGSYMVIKLALETGMRIGEIFGLQWKNIDLEKKNLLVAGTIVHTNHTNIYQPTGKTKSSYRRIPFSSALKTTLMEYRAWQQREKEKWGEMYTDSDFVITKPLGGFSDPSNFSARTFKKLLDKAGITRQFRVHDLRHTHATWLLEAGINVKVISERLGHSSCRITMDTYSHVMQTMQDKAVEMLEQINAELDEK
ncbi:site-specific integrase [Megasphaera sp. SW808]|uniref:site-specific integrase n=1 Tax=Megasphaera sp. SW808 TaxID=2530045 RepID=UPI00143AA441|nr:site-specific integrase [Megasphaera sp. SW808]NJE35626.1 site-specific integrase [Megasphaera sp. SW808]